MPTSHHARVAALAVATLLAGCSSPEPDLPIDPIDATPAEARQWIEAYKAAHPGNGGKDWDVNAKSNAELAQDADARRLIALCGGPQRPVIPLLAWEYGGGDHQWIDPAASALVYCIYTPISPSTPTWSYDAAADHVIADMYVRFREDNPCAAEIGAAQVASCIGDSTNFELLVDTASRNDGAGAGLSLSESSTELRLILADGTKVHLLDNL